MNFGDNLKFLMEMTNISNSDLSKLTKIDPSLISRFKNGKRIPHNSSIEIKNISSVFTNIDDTKIENLYTHFNTKDKNELEILIYNFLNTSNLKTKKGINDKKKILLTRYSEKLDKCMNLLLLSNIDVAKNIKTDTSLISRYRNGHRNVYSDNSIIEKISKYLCEVADEKNKLYELYKLTSSKNTFDKDKMLNYLTLWFKSNEKLSKDISIENFLLKLSAYSHANIKNCANVNEIIVSDNTFIGKRGLQDAILYFLKGLITKDATTLHFYTSEVGSSSFPDEEYKKEWTSLMHTLIQKGNKIILYNDTEYSVENMIDSILSFMPLYYTGQIECRYVTKTQKQKFDVNFYLAENSGYLFSSGVINTKEYTEYFVSFDPIKTQIYTKQFENLTNYSYPLLLIKDISNYSKYIKLYEEYSESNEDTIGLLSTPFIGTISLNLLNRILDRNKIDEYQKKKIIEYYNSRNESFKKMIENTKIIDYIITDTKGVHLDLYNIYDEKTIYYTEKEYNEHIKHIKLLSKKYPNYNVKFISNIPYNNIKVLVKKDYGVIISKEEKNSKVSFLLKHSIFIDSFTNYISILENN